MNENTREAVLHQLWDLGHDYVAEVLETWLIVVYRGTNGEYGSVELAPDAAL